MNVDWQRVKELFNEAVELPREERDSFLDAACAGNVALRREIDALLIADDEASGFLAVPDEATGATATAAAADIATEPRPRHEAISSGKLRFCPRCSGRFSTADIVCPVDGEVLVEDPEALVDTTIDGLYHVIRMIGRGGFGVVYLARHALLRDQVAIKVLPRQLSSDPERIERFLREGRAARAIHHPNLVTVYDLRASSDGLTYMVQEYIEGHTLRDELELRGKFAAEDVLTLLEPIAAALDEAHAHGIVHRDLKPDNIMLSVTGSKRTAKLLDLGIVKLQEILSQPSGADHNVTHPGHFIGTPSYMSPEQWGTPPEDGGPDIDGRADVYSFGVVMFEMLSGRQPFRGRSMSEIRRAHLLDPPPLLSETEPTLSMAFSQTLARAMAKARAERPTTAGAFMREMRTSLGASTGSRASGHSAGSLPTRELPPTEIAPPLSLAERASGRWHSVRSVVVALGIAAVLGVAIFGAWRFLQPTPGGSARPAVADAGEQITNTGNAVDAAISPDGLRVATVERVGSRHQLNIVHLPTRGTLPLGELTDSRLYGLTFSPDGNYVYFVEEPADGDSVLNRISVGGGSAQRVLSNIESAVAFSPGADELAYIRGGSEPGVRELIVASTDGSRVRAIASTSGIQLFAPEGPSWSPDGARIACSVIELSPGIRGSISIVTLADGVLAPLTRPEWYYVGRLHWMTSGNRIVASATREPMGAMQLWAIELPDGTAVALKPDLNSNDGVAVSADGSALVTVRTSLPTRVWQHSPSEPTGDRPLPLGTSRFYGVSWTADGRLLFASSTSGSPDIWISDADGRYARQLTFEDAFDRDPVMTRDGRFVFFSSNRSGTFNIWRMNADGSDLRQITFGQDDEFPACAPDGTFLIYQSAESLAPRLWRVAMDGSDPVQILDAPAKWPSIAPDGGRLACTVLDRSSMTWKAAIVPIAGGSAPQFFEVPMLSAPRFEWQRVRWSGDGQAVTYLAEEDGGTALYALSVADGTRTRVASFKGDKVLSYDVRQQVIVATRAPITSDIVLIRDFAAGP